MRAPGVPLRIFYCLIFFCLLGVRCSTSLVFTPFEPNGREPGSLSADYGYIFVSVFMESTNAHIGVAGHHIGVAWKNETTGEAVEFHILPESVMGTYALQVPPGNYRPAYSFSSITNQIWARDRKSFPGLRQVPVSLSVGPGQVAYAGHYKARITVEHGIGETTTTGELDTPSYSPEDFERARVQLIMLYPAFNGMEFKYEQ